jgi:hypothetical protein
LPSSNAELLLSALSAHQSTLNEYFGSPSEPPVLDGDSVFGEAVASLSSFYSFTVETITKYEATVTTH